MEALQTRIRQLAALQSDVFRVHEHSTLDRLMYKNRNQHRRGPYFQRLEHVRRMVRKVNNHPAWRFVRSAASAPAASNSKQKKAISKRRKAKPLSVSAETLCDFEELAAMLENFVEAIIPKAASHITLELICREHFLPFAVAVVAALARIYTVERALLRAVQGIAADARIMTAVPAKSVTAGTNRVFGGGSVVEDVGEIIRVEDCKDLEIRQPVQLQRPMHLPGASKAGRRMVNRFCSVGNEGNVKNGSKTREEFHGSADGVAKRENEALLQPCAVGKTVPESTGSLYDLMAEEDPELASIAEAHVVNSGRITIGEAETRELSLHQGVNGCGEADRKENTDNGLKIHGEVPNSAENVEDKCESSESEDLDDIFANLSD